MAGLVWSGPRGLLVHLSSCPLSDVETSAQCWTAWSTWSRKKSRWVLHFCLIGREDVTVFIQLWQWASSNDLTLPCSVSQLETVFISNYAYTYQRGVMKEQKTFKAYKHYWTTIENTIYCSVNVNEVQREFCSWNRQQRTACHIIIFYHYYFHILFMLSRRQLIKLTVLIETKQQRRGTTSCHRLDAFYDFIIRLTQTDRRSSSGL